MCLLVLESASCTVTTQPIEISMRNQIKLLAGLVLMAFPAYGGFTAMSVMVLPLLAVSFTYAYCSSKWSMLRQSILAESVQKNLRNLVITYLTQLVVVAVFYFLFLGIAALLRDPLPNQALFGSREWNVAAIALVYVVIIGWIPSLFSSARTEISGEEQEMLALLKEVSVLATQTVTMPVTIFSLARRLADLPDKENTLLVMHEILLAEENPHVRRVFYTMIRFMGETQFEHSNIHDLLLKGLDEAAPWVRYDAVWAIEVQRTYSPEIMRRLALLAGGYSGDEEIQSGDAEANVKKRAAITLRAAPSA